VRDEKQVLLEHFAVKWIRLTVKEMRRNKEES